MNEHLRPTRSSPDLVLCQNSAQPASTKELRLSKSGETLAHEQVTRRPPTLDCGSTRGLGLDREPAPLVVREPETLAPKPGSEHTVLLLQVVDHILLLAVDPVLCQNSALLKNHVCNLMHRKVLVSFYQHLMAEAPMRSV